MFSVLGGKKNSQILTQPFKITILNVWVIAHLLKDYAEIHDGKYSILLYS